MKLIWSVVILGMVACQSLKSKNSLDSVHVKDSSRGRLYMHEARTFKLALATGHIISTHVVDMTHEGPKKYYDDVKDFIVAIDDTGVKRKYILAESYKCTGTRPAFNEAKFSIDLFPDMSDVPKPDESSASQIAYAKEYQRRLIDLQPKMRAAGFLTTAPCQTKPIKVSRSDFISQHELQHWMKTSSGYEFIDSDLDLSKMPEEYAAVIAGDYIPFGDETELYKWWVDSDSGRALSSAHGILITHLYRENLVFDNINKIIEKGSSANIVVPWGAFHSENIYSWLRARGFEEVPGKKDIVYDTCESLKTDYGANMRCYVDFAKQIKTFRGLNSTCDAKPLEKFNISTDTATYIHPFVHFSRNHEPDRKIFAIFNPFIKQELVKDDTSLEVNGHFFEPMSEAKDSKLRKNSPVAIQLEFKFRRNGNESSCVSQYFPAKDVH